MATLQTPTPLPEVLRDELGENVYRCYQCIKCTSGCPLADQFDLTPNQVMRSAQLNQERVLESMAIWLCASCHVCATRCPQGIDVTSVMSALRREAGRRGVPAAIPEIARFNTLYMRMTGLFGRVYELGLMAVFNLMQCRPTKDFVLGLRLLRRGRMRLFPQIVRWHRRAKPLASPAGKIAYFPGCAAQSTAREYDQTVRVAARALDLELVEPENWSCCGSSVAPASDPDRAITMPMRAVTTVERMGMTTLTSPCSACFSRLRQAEKRVRDDSSKAKLVTSEVGAEYGGSVHVEHLVDTFVHRVGLKSIAERASARLNGMKVACYYGCLITRPHTYTQAENHEHPMQMDRLMSALGAEPVSWSHKTDCCGGALSVTRSQISVKLVQRILGDALACGAEAVVTMCPLCHLNLDARQEQMALTQEIPILHATQLMVLALGEGERAAELDGNLIDPKPILRQRQILDK